MSRVAFIGLGAMGYPMAVHLARARHAVTVEIRATSKATCWQSEFAGNVTVAPAAAPRKAEFVLPSVRHDDGAALPTGLIDQYYGALQTRGRHRQDTSRLISLLQDT